MTRRSPHLHKNSVRIEFLDEWIDLKGFTGCGTGCPGAINTALAYDGDGNLLSETTTVVGQTGSSTKRYAWDLDNRRAYGVLSACGMRLGHVNECVLKS